MSKSMYRARHVIYIATALAVLILMSVVMVACNNSTDSDQQRLATPQQVRIEGKVLTWQSVEFAAGYTVEIRRGSNVDYEYVHTNIFSLPLAIGQYLLRVRATNSSQVSDYSDIFEYSVDATPLDTPQQVMIDGEYLVWQEVTNASGYEVKVVNVDSNIEDIASVATTSYKLPTTPLGQYTLQVRALSQDDAHTNSEYSEPVSYEATQQPQAIFDIQINGESYNTDLGQHYLSIGVYEVQITFDVSPDDAINYTKSFEIRQSDAQYASIDSDGNFKVLDKTKVNGYVGVELRANNVSKSIYIMYNHARSTEVSVYFSSNGGSFISGGDIVYKAVKYGELVPNISIPNKSGHKFEYWSLTKDGDDVFELPQQLPIEWLKEDSIAVVYLYAKWIPFTLWESKDNK